jgi:hypothetical protein
VAHEIYYSRNTVGCNVGGEIFIHPELYKHPKLYHAILAHEKKHTTGMAKQDISLDMFNDELKDCKGEFYRFMLSHPRTLLGYLPLTKVGRYWAFDFEMLAVWLFVLGVGYYVGVNL